MSLPINETISEPADSFLTQPFEDTVYDLNSVGVTGWEIYVCRDGLYLVINGTDYIPAGLIEMIGKTLTVVVHYPDGENIERAINEDAFNEMLNIFTEHERLISGSADDIYDGSTDNEAIGTQAGISSLDTENAELSLSDFLGYT